MIIEFEYKMLLFILVSFCVLSGTRSNVINCKQPQSDCEELQWPDVYKVKATKVSLISNFMEDITAWKTVNVSRIDYNDGAVKVITKIEFDDGYQYEIHPETTEEYYNKVVCRINPFYGVESVESILPTLSEDELYEVKGNEVIDDIDTVKFEYIDENREEETRNTIWAYNDDEIGWIPVRYEVKKYSVIFGSEIKHEIWTYFDFDVDIEYDVFETKPFGCDFEHTISPNDNKVVKELLFVNPENERHINHVFNHFLNKYNKKYAHAHEHALRKTIFTKNMRMISSVNRKNLGYKLGVNQFSDRTPEELKNSLGAIPRPEGRVGTVPFPYNESKLQDISNGLPQYYDMRVLGLVSPVKDQGECGSCWTFAAAAVVESGLARLNGGRVLSLSNQAIVDCAYEYLGEMEAGGCHGGFDFAAYDWIQAHGLPTDKEYGPYKMRDGYCNINNMTKTYKITGYSEVTANNAIAMKVALINHGPLFIYIHVSAEFMSYSSGIFYQHKTACKPNRPNHAVTLVGYGERDGNPYWIIKNSWGANWGIDGYMLIAGWDNVCGVASKPSYPIF